MKSIEPRRLPTCPENHGLAKEKGEVDADNTLFGVGQVARLGSRMKNRASSAKSRVAARKILDVSAYEGRAPVMSAHFSECRLDCCHIQNSSSPTVESVLKSEAPRVLGRRGTHEKDSLGDYGTKREGKNAPSSAENPPQ